MVGGILLVITYIIYNHHEDNNPGIGFNYAYISGIAMIIKEFFPQRIYGEF